MSVNKNCIVFAGGGTGGHIYPGLAVCEEVKNLFRERGEDVKIVWLGNKGGMDRNIVEKSGIENDIVDSFIGIPSGKLRRYFTLKNVLDFFKIFAGCVVSYFTLLKLKPRILFSKGGFVSVTPCFAAKLLKIPVFTHECDFTPGLATRINSRFASKILVSYEETKKYFPESKRDSIIVSGNPVRPVFYNPDEKNGLDFLGLSERVSYDKSKREKPILLVIGGSLGAHQINELVKENLSWLTENFIVVHQTGKADAQNFENLKSENYLPYAFIYKEMCDVIAASDVVLSRSGANSLWECAVLGKPLVLVPLCGSGTRGDQVDNAKFFEEKGAAFVLNGKDADSENLRKALSKMLDSNTRNITGENCKKMLEGKRPARFIAELLV